MNADMPLTHTYVTSEGDTLVEHFIYEDNTNKVKQCITTKNGYVVDGYNVEYTFRLTDLNGDADKWVAVLPLVLIDDEIIVIDDSGYYHFNADSELGNNGLYLFNLV